LIDLIYLLPALTGMLMGIAMAAFMALRRPGRNWVLTGAFAFLLALWCGGQLFWYQAQSLALLVAICRLQYVAIALVPLLWLIICLRETSRFSEWPWSLPLLLAVPVVTLYLVADYQPGSQNPLWLGFELRPEGGISRVTHGPWFPVLMLYSYGVVGLGCLLMFFHFSQSPHYHLQLLMSTVAPLLTLALNFSYFAGYWPGPLDPTPIGFSLGIAAWAWVFYRRRVLEISPVSRDLAIDSLAESIFIIDHQGRVLDYNRAANTLLGNIQPVLGVAIQELIPQLPEPTALVKPHTFTSASGRHLEAKVSAAANDSDRDNASLILLIRDVTKVKKTHALLHQVGQELEVANRELDRLAHTDELTGLANRRLLLARLDEEIARARRLGHPLAVLFIDLDHFKAVNDSHGHSFGDAVLRAVGMELLKHRKGIDIAARYGGEELILVLTNTDHEGIFKVAERVWRTLGELNHCPPGETPSNVTASIGIALLEPGDLAGYDLIDRADSALYYAKQHGRNRVCLAQDGDFATLFARETSIPSV
jgi:diguanylate cyclase (GGDEF)-like protein